MDHEPTFRPIRTRTPRAAALANLPPLTTWPTPPVQSMDAGATELYYKNKLAVELYVQHSNEAEIKQRTGFAISKARKLTERCLRRHPHTEAMVGLWACVPGRRMPGETHQRKSGFNPELAKSGKGMKGALADLFRRYPLIQAEMLQFIKTRHLTGEAPVPLITSKAIVSVFHRLCRRMELREDQWPFNTARMGENAILDWWKRTKADYPVETTSNQFGTEAAQLARLDNAMIATTKPPFVLNAYARMELDEHLVHAMCSIGIPNRKGTMTWVCSRRVWCLALVDVRSGAILSCVVCYGDKYDSNDVLALVRKAIFPPARRTLTLADADFCYTPDAAFPGELTEFHRNTFQVLAWDNAAEHKSLALRGLIRQTVGADVVFERVGEPTARNGIEGLFAKVAAEFEVLPSGTGTNPQSPARRDPEESAQKWKLYAHELEEVLDVFCRNFNSKPSTKCGGLSPLAFLKELNLKGEVFSSPLGELGPNNAYKLLPSYPGYLTRRRGKFGPLRVCLFGASYSSVKLANNALLAYATDTSVTVYVEDDARMAHVVPNAHPELCFQVMVIDKDLRGFPHSLQWRRLAEAAISNTVGKGEALTPNLMMGVLGAIGEAAQENLPGAVAQLGGISGFMATSGSNGTTFVMALEQREKLLAETEHLVETFDEEGAEGAPPSAVMAPASGLTSAHAPAPAGAVSPNHDALRARPSQPPMNDDDPFQLG